MVNIEKNLHSPENINDILNKNEYLIIVNNISESFKQRFPNFQLDLKTFLSKEPKKYTEKRFYNEYIKIIKRVPDIYSLYTRENKTKQDYKALLSENNRAYFSDSQIQKLQEEFDGFEIKEKTETLELHGIDTFSSFIDKTKAIESIYQNEIISYLKYLKKLDSSTITILEKPKPQNLEKQIKTISLRDIQTISEIDTFLSSNNRIFKDLIPNNFAHKYNEISNIWIKNWALDLATYYSYLSTETQLSRLRKKQQKLSEVYISPNLDNADKQLSYPWIEKATRFFEKNSRTIQKILSWEKTWRIKEALIEKMTREFRQIIKEVKQENWYIPWEYREYLEKIETLWKPEKNLIEFLHLFKSYLSSWVEQGIWKWSNESDQEVIKEVEFLIKEAQSWSDSLAKLWVDWELEDRLEDFYEYLLEWIEWQDWKRIHISIDEIDNFIKNLWTWKDIDFHTLKTSLASHMVTSEIAGFDELPFYSNTANLQEWWNLVRNDIVSLIPGEVEAQKKLYNDKLNIDFSNEEISLFKEQIEKIPRYTKEAILKNNDITIGWNIDGKLLTHFVEQAKENWIKYMAEYDAVRLSYKSGKLSKKLSNEQKKFLDNFYDTNRNVKEIWNLVIREAILFAISTALLAGSIWAISRIASLSTVGALAINTGWRVLTWLNRTERISKFTLRWANLASEVAIYTAASNSLNNGEFSMKYFIENLAMIWWGVAWFTIGWKLIKPWTSKFKTTLSTISSVGFWGLWSIVWLTAIELNNGQSVSVMEIENMATQASIMWVMMLPILLWRSGWNILAKMKSKKFFNEWTPLRNRLFEYEGFNIVEKQLKFMWKRLIEIPEVIILKSVSREVIENIQVIQIKLKDPITKNINNISIRNIDWINNKLINLCIEQGWHLKAIYSKWKVEAYYIKKEGKKVYYDTSWNKIKKPWDLKNRESISVTQSIEITPSQALNLQIAENAIKNNPEARSFLNRFSNKLIWAGIFLGMIYWAWHFSIEYASNWFEENKDNFDDIIKNYIKENSDFMIPDWAKEVYSFASN